MITLRPYQQQGVNDTVDALRRSKRKSVIMEMPTGGGKTVVFSYIVSRAEAKGSKILILTDREELLRGTGGTLEQFGSRPQYIQAGRTHPPDSGQTFVAMAQTLKNRLSKPKWSEFLDSIDLVIIDECHKQEFNAFFEAGIFKGKTIIGFSATPKRGGKQRQLAEDYDEIVHTLTTKELIELGFLMPEMYCGFKDSPDMKGVKKNSKGDYSESDMFKKYDTPKLYGGVIDEWREHVPNTTTLVFCTNIIHSVRTAKEFCSNGIKAKFVCSSMAAPKRPESYESEDRASAAPEWIKYYEKLDYYNEYKNSMAMYSGERNDLIKRWKSGEFPVLVNAGILTTGFDFPAIETIVLFRATISEVLYLQMLGRGSRPCKSIDKTHFNILDFGLNAERLGGYKMPRLWALHHSSGAGSGVPPIKECGESGTPDKNKKLGCDEYILASVKICPECGYIFRVEKELEKAKLSPMSQDDNGKFRAVKPVSQMSFDEMERFSKANGYKIGWIINRLLINKVVMKVAEFKKREALVNILTYSDIQAMERYFKARYSRQALSEYAKYKGHSHGWVHVTMSRMKIEVIN
jgi:superfamily II DNA or RNA helicase